MSIWPRATKRYQNARTDTVDTQSGIQYPGILFSPDSFPFRCPVQMKFVLPVAKQIRMHVNIQLKNFHFILNTSGSSYRLLLAYFLVRVSRRGWWIHRSMSVILTLSQGH